MPVAIITGATKGIGRAIVEKLAQAGYDIGFCARTASDITALESQLQHQYPNQKFLGAVADLSIQADLIAFGTRILANWPHIDVLVNNGGIFIPGTISEEANGIFEQLMLTNVASAYHLTRLVLPNMKIKNSGHIINMCSTASLMGYKNGGSYCISKFALLGFNKALREELKSSKIKVTAIMPGATLTHSWAGAPFPSERFIPPQDIALAVYNCILMSPSTVVEELLIRPIDGDIS